MARFVCTLALVCAFVLPPVAHARIILFDANFDTRPLLQGLDRRGAEFGEPIPGFHDTGNELVWFDAVGDHSLRMTDSTISGGDAELLYFGFVNDLLPSDGKVYLSAVVNPKEVGNYALFVMSEDGVSSIATIQFDAASFAYYADGTSGGPQQFLFYTPDQEYTVEFEMNLSANMYSVSFDGLIVRQDEPIDPGTTIGSFAIGHDFDGNTDGVLTIDDVQVSWAPGSNGTTAAEFLNARFNDKADGQTIGTGGAAVGEPVQFDGAGITAIVRHGVTTTPSLELEDVSTANSGALRFRPIDGTLITSGNVGVSFTLQFDDLEDWQFRLEGLDLAVEADEVGAIILFDTSVSPKVEIARHPYSLGGVFKLELGFALDQGLFHWWVADELIVHRAAIPASATSLRSLDIGLAADADTGEVVRVDNIEIFHDGSALASTNTQVSSPHPRVAILDAPSPNPFNPATTLSFSMTRGGRAELTVFDVRGRQVRSLVREHLPAGDHRIVWRGLDDAGAPVASGVYHAVLRAGRDRSTQRLTLLK